MALQCPFSEDGCEFQHDDLDAIRSHMRSSPLSHTSLLCNAVRSMFGELRALQKIQEKQEQEIALLESRLIAMKHVIGAHLIWKIDKYEERLEQAKTGLVPILYSEPFLTTRYGYKLIISACLNGDGKAVDNFMSIFVSICRSENDPILSWPFSHTITLTLLNQSDDVSQREHAIFVIKPTLAKENEPFIGRPKTERNTSFGAQNFVPLNMMEKMNFVRDNCIFIKVNVTAENM